MAQFYFDSVSCQRHALTHSDSCKWYFLQEQKRKELSSKQCETIFFFFFFLCQSKIETCSFQYKKTLCPHLPITEDAKMIGH